MDREFIDEELRAVMERVEQDITERPCETHDACEKEASSLEWEIRSRPSICEGCEELCAILNEAMASIDRFASAAAPHSTIFTNADDRVRAFAAIRNLLLSLDARTGELRTVCARFSNGESRERAILRAVRFRAYLQLLAKSGRRILDSDQPESLLRRMECVDCERERWETEADALLLQIRRYYAELLPKFYRRAEEKADLLHEGRACDAHALIRLTGELKSRIVQLRDALSAIPSKN